MRIAVVVLLGLTGWGCYAIAPGTPRYVVTTAPLNLLNTAHPGFCIAVDPADARGVWWWEPGRSGCSGRSTGPALMPASRASVVRSADATRVRFEVQLMRAEPLQVQLTLDGTGMRSEPSGERVPTERRRNLDIPESCCPQPMKALLPAPSAP